MYRITQSTLLQRFAERHPALQVHFVMSDKYVDLHKGEADVALRSGDTDDGELVGRKIGDSVWAVYASKDYIERRGRPQHIEELAQHALVGFDDTMAKHRIASVVEPRSRPTCRRTRTGAPASGLFRKGGGRRGPLADRIGDAEPDLGG